MSFIANRYTNKIFDFFSKGHQRSINIKRNILAIFVYRIISICVTFLMVPLTIQYVNPTKYGVWLTLSSIVGWISYFDIGFGNGLRNKFAEAVAKGKFKLARIYVSTTYAILIIIFGLFLVLFFIINPFLNWASILNAPTSLSEEISLLATITISFFCLQAVLQLISTILTANQQPAKASLIALLSNVISLLIIYVLMLTTKGSLINLGLTLSLSPLIIYLLSSYFLFSNRYRKFAPSIKFVKFRFTNDLMGLGIKFFILQIATLFLYQVSNLIIAHLFGADFVTSYNIAYKYFGLIPMIMVIVMMPLWSAFTDSWVKNDITWIKNTMNKLRTIWLFLSLVSIFMLIFSDMIYEFWVGKDIHVPFSTSLVMSVFVIVAVGNGIYSIFLNGIGIVNIQLYLSILGMILYIPISFILGEKLGLYGVLIPMVLINGIILIFQIVQFKKIINLKAKGIWLK